jgi:hypothetical protein
MGEFVPDLPRRVNGTKDPPEVRPCICLPALQFDGNRATQLIDSERALRGGNLALEPIVRAHAAALFDALQAPELYTFIPTRSAAIFGGWDSSARRRSKRLSISREDPATSTSIEQSEWNGPWGFQSSEPSDLAQFQRRSLRQRGARKSIFQSILCV